MIHIGNTISAVQTPIIPVIGEWARNTPGTLSLGQGMVSYPPPSSTLKYIQDFGLLPEHHLYGSPLGYEPLLRLIANKLNHENGIKQNDVNQIMVTAGSNMAFLNVLRVITDPGDEIILPLPYYFNQEMAIRMLNCIPVSVPTDSNYQLQLEALRGAITDKTRAIVTVSPNNPTGAVYPEAALRAVNQLCKEHNLYHISDEAYEYFTYGSVKHFSPASIPGAEFHTISLFSLSKAYGFASWRIGYLVFPQSLLSSLLKVQDTNLICAPLITQYAAVGALEVGHVYCRNHVQQLNKTREQFVGRLHALDRVKVVPTDGAFYLLLKLDIQVNDLELAKKLIYDYKVAVIPGSAFGLHEGCYLRVSYGMLDGDSSVIALDRLISGINLLNL